MIGMTMCSGIGAPEMAAPWVDWRMASEIEPFPRAVLQERFGYRLPKDHNQGDPLLWGDMTEVSPALMRERGVPLPDLLVAGTPCQAFSVAGLRRGTADARGNLTLKFVEIVHEIVAARPDGELAVLWENVPGVLSDKGNAFGCFLAGLVGADDAFEPPAGASWPGIGMVSGPRARAAWRVLDAQYFGVAQRRRRVFVVCDFGNTVDPAAVLFERKSLRGNTPPRREAGQGSAAHAAQGVAIRGRDDGGTAELSGAISTALRASQGGGDKPHVLAPDTAHCLQTTCDDYSRADGFNMIAHSLRGEGFDASEDGTGRGTPIVPVDITGTMKSMEKSGGWSNSADHAAAGFMVPVAFDTTQITSAANYSNPQPGGPCHPLAAGAHPAAIAIQERAVCENADAGPDGAGFRTDDAAYTLEARSVPQAVMTPWAVRRLTPTECHRLQGFPDDHCAITYRGKPAADGPQYKALGNSMAVPCVAWILDRIKISHEQSNRKLSK